MYVLFCLFLLIIVSSGGDFVSPYREFPIAFYGIYLCYIIEKELNLQYKKTV